MSNQYLVVYVTTPTMEVAEQIGQALVEKQLAACANLLPGLHSIYRWQGQVCNEPEVLMIIKTSETRFSALTDLIRNLHPYEVPEIIALPIIAGSPDYLAWIGANTRSEDQPVSE